jgi:hypothetical protein
MHRHTAWLFMGWGPFKGHKPLPFLHLLPAQNEFLPPWGNIIPIESACGNCELLAAEPVLCHTGEVGVFSSTATSSGGARYPHRWPWTGWDPDLHATFLAPAALANLHLHLVLSYSHTSLPGLQEREILLPENLIAFDAYWTECPIWPTDKPSNPSMSSLTHLVIHKHKKTVHWAPGCLAQEEHSGFQRAPMLELSLEKLDLAKWTAARTSAKTKRVMEQGSVGSGSLYHTQCASV